MDLTQIYIIYIHIQWILLSCKKAFATVWMDPEGVMLCEISQRKTGTVSLVCGFEKRDQTQKQQGVGNQSLVLRGRVKWVKMVNRHTLSAVRHTIPGAVCIAR